jgi:hypothetical protein
MAISSGALTDRMSGRFTIALIVWHPQVYAGNFYASASAMVSSLHWAESHLPKVALQHRLLFNMEIVPAFTFTRVIRTGEILTMEYCKLNQRDSFWMSFVHFVLFRDAEQKMIQESCDAQPSVQQQLQASAVHPEVPGKDMVSHEVIGKLPNSLKAFTKQFRRRSSSRMGLSTHSRPI